MHEGQVRQTGGIISADCRLHRLVGKTPNVSKKTFEGCGREQYFYRPDALPNQQLHSTKGTKQQHI